MMPKMDMAPKTTEYHLVQIRSLVLVHQADSVQHLPRETDNIFGSVTQKLRDSCEVPLYVGETSYIALAL